MFGEDAKQAAALLELNLTTRELPGTGRRDVRHPGAQLGAVCGEAARQA